MSETATNAAEAAYWNDEAGPRWVAGQERMDAAMAPLTDQLLAAAGARAGERVLDIGCGCGATVLALRELVSPGGHILAVDVSAPMLDVARTRVARGQGADVDLVLGDAAEHVFSPNSVDLIVSRFGVMFFRDPVAAFANIRTALRPGGRMAFVCWRPMAESTFFRVPATAAKLLLPPVPPADPLAPGPFAFADPARVRAILEAAGFADVAIEPRNAPMPTGELDATVSQTMAMGPISRMLADVDDATRIAVRAALTLELRGYLRESGVVLEGAVWLVTARA